MKYSVLFISSIFFLLTTCKTPTTIASVNHDSKVKSRIDALVKDNGLPGLNFSVIQKDGRIENYTSGYADKEAQIMLTTNHTFFSGSIGKTYAVALLMQLVDSGIVDLEEKIKSYFPEISWLSELPNIEDITVRMLLQHTSGLPRYVLKPAIWEVLHANPDKVWTYKERLSYIFGDDPVHAAGKAWAYSDTNYILLGMLIEKITERKYYDLVKERLLIHYGLENTYPNIQRVIPNLAVGYSQLPPAFKIPNKTVENGAYVFNPQIEWTGGGINSSASDLAKWAKLYYEGKLFSRALLKQITQMNPLSQKEQGSNGYGMGSFIYNTKHGLAYGHSGFMPGFNSIFAYFPDMQVAVAMQINCDYAGQKMSLNKYLDEILDVELHN